jgi:hypothetical protein
VLLSNLLNAQEEVTGGELMIHIKDNATHPKNVAIEVQKWSDFCWTAYNNIYDLTTIFNGGILYSENPSQSLFEIFGCWEHPENPTSTMGLALYKITAYVQITSNGNYVYKDHFYIDYRTSSIPIIGGCDYALDFSVYYGVFRYVNTTTLFPEETAIWNLVSIPLIKTELEPLPPEDLIQTATTGCPVLNWVHPIDCEYRTGYNIYRSISGSNYDLAGSTDCSTNTFTDVGIQLNGGGTANYKVKAKNGTRESISSNIISVNIVAIDKKQFKLENQLISSPVLLQNYPNPFNPSTTINYSIPKAQNVSIIIYDILGKKVIDLVNGYKEAGDHSIEFDGSNLFSGVYYYVMRNDNFVQTKRLVLVK